MISPELLRRYPFFGQLTDAHLKALAMVSEVEEVKAGTLIFAEGKPADYFYFLLEGSIDLTYNVGEGLNPKTFKVFQVGEINPEEVFGISSLIEPYSINANGTAAVDCRYIAIDAKALRAMMEMDNRLGFLFMSRIAKVALQQLVAIRVQLAAAWA
jgi:CRP/FNR family transcriptional regulator, cyclic AMP receptor protein